MEKQKLTIAISSCLLGKNVRYDGKSKWNDSLIQKLSPIVTLLPICPEVEIGMSVPRERLQLVRYSDKIKMIAEESQKDWTAEMREFSYARIRQDDFKKISGLILKSKSPSCGMKNVEVFQDGQLISKTGDGIFASIVQQECDSLPITDELALRDSNNFDKFINSVHEFANQNKKKNY